MDKQQVTSRQSSPFQRSGAHGKIYELKRIDTNTITNDQDNEDLTKLNFPFTTSSSYEGMWENTMKHGYGTQSLQDGTKYEGNWKFNKKQGQGSLYTKKSGKKLQLTYEGSWANNMKEGHGSYFYSNGDHYKGDWKLDKRSGHGRLETISGDVYEGSWVDGKLSGEAHAILSNRNVFAGRYKEGKRSGYGRLYYHETGRVN